MRKNRLSARLKALVLPILGITTIAFTSCAQDGYDDDERWSSGVNNTALASPDADSIKIIPSADGSKTNISWPVVYGAKGYKCYVTDITPNGDTLVVADSLIDGCSMNVAREEDLDYTVSIKTIGNETLGNTDAAEASVKKFNTFTKTYATIPDGTDLSDYFNTNPIPADSTSLLCYNLEPGGKYTVNGELDLQNHNITIRTSVPTNHATITYGASGKIKTAAGLNLKYTDFDMTNCTNRLIEMDDNAGNYITANADGLFLMTDPVTINSCNITGLSNSLFYSSVNYAIKTFIVKNCKVHCNTVPGVKTTFIYCKGGFINDLTVQNSTFWDENTTNGGFFAQINGGPSKNAGWLNGGSATYQSCTFYNIVNTGKLGNYNMMKRVYTFTLSKCIFVNCSSGTTARRFVDQQKSTTNTFSLNTYWYNGTAESSTDYDKSGSQIDEDPQFADPANGDFTPKNAKQISAKTGDPRWLK